jgi:hypothetical protein
MKLMPASKLFQIKRIPQKSFSFEKLVDTFIGGKLSTAIVEAVKEGHNQVNVEVPTEAYRDLNKFYEIANQRLTSLGYTSQKSHDGGGMYNTLFVTWKI